MSEKRIFTDSLNDILNEINKISKFIGKKSYAKIIMPNPAADPVFSLLALSIIGRITAVKILSKVRAHIKKIMDYD